VKLLRVDASIRTDGSTSRSLADAAERAWTAAHPDAEVVRRDLGAHPLPSLWLDACAAAGVPDTDRTLAQRRGVALAGELVDELLEADAYVLAVPLYNFGVPQQVKQWIDLIICDPRANDVNVPLLPGRPALLLQARGGSYAPGTPRAGWDHATPYLRRILEDVWGLDVVVIDAELTAAQLNPAMADLRGIAEESAGRAHAAAADHAARIVERVLAGAASS
jgi:FMN-dependent NADH-azoreductase